MCLNMHSNIFARPYKLPPGPVREHPRGVPDRHSEPFWETNPRADMPPAERSESSAGRAIRELLRRGPRCK